MSKKNQNWKNMSEDELDKFIFAMTKEGYEQFRASMSDEERLTFDKITPRSGFDDLTPKIKSLIAGRIIRQELRPDITPDIEIYQKEYPEKLVEFLDKYHDSNEKDFIQFELERLEKFNPPFHQEKINIKRIEEFLKHQQQNGDNWKQRKQIGF